MPESISQWSQEFLPSVLLSLTFWTLAAAVAGFLAGSIFFLFLRLIRVYRMKFQLGALVAIVLFLYTVFVTTFACASIGFLESIKRQAEGVLATPDNRAKLGELAGTLSSRSAALAYAYGNKVLESENSEPDLPELLVEMNHFEKGKWGIDLSKSDAAFDQITDEVIQQNYEKLYGMVFKDVGGDKEDSRQQMKSVLDILIKSDKLSSTNLIEPIRKTLADLESKRSRSGPVYADELKAHAGENTAQFITYQLGGIILTQQIFLGVFSAIAVAIPMVLVIIIKILIRVSSRNTKPVNPVSNPGTGHEQT